MEQKMISVNVKTFDSESSLVDALSIDNCAPQQLNAILSLCKPGMKVEIQFDVIDISHAMSTKLNG